MSEPSSRRVWGQRPGQLSKVISFLKSEGSASMFQDKSLVCKDCDQEFVFTAGEQEFYAEKGFTNTPQRCKSCRDSRKQGGNNRGSQQREMHNVVCAACGTNTQVPFAPRNDRPVYCRDCYSSQR